MKKWISCLLLLAILALLPTASLSADTRYVVSNPNPADRLHLRVSPSEGATSLGKYYNGTELALLEDLGDWLKVRIGGNPGGLEGYMLRKYIAVGSAAGKVKSAMPQYVSVGSAWELLDQPGKQASYRMFGYGEAFLLMGFTPSWWHVTTLDGRATGFLPASNAVLQKPFPAVVNNPSASDRLHLRTKPDKSSASLGKYYNGVTVTVMSYHGDVQWAHVRIGTLEGYMDASFLAVEQNMKNVAIACPTVAVQVPAGEHLHLRQQPSDQSPSLGRYANNTSVLVYGISDAWYHVQVNGKEGFMLAKYLRPQLPK